MYIFRALLVLERDARGKATVEQRTRPCLRGLAANVYRTPQVRSLMPHAITELEKDNELYPILNSKGLKILKCNTHWMAINWIGSQLRRLRKHGKCLWLKGHPLPYHRSMFLLSRLLRVQRPGGRMVSPLDSHANTAHTCGTYTA